MVAFIVIYIVIGLVKLVIDMGRPFVIRPMFLNEPFSKTPATWVIGVLIWPVRTLLEGRF